VVTKTQQVLWAKGSKSRSACK